MPSESRPKSGIAAILSALISLAALGVSAGAYWQSRQTENQLNQQEASKVYLGEAPLYAYPVHPSRSGQIWWVVMNYSPLQVNDVWVEGEHGKYVRMWGVQGCSMYAVPQGFVPVAVDYSDSIARWRHTTDGLPQENGKPLPSRGDESSPWDMSIQNCG